MSITALIKATESLKKREGDLLPILKAVFFEELKNRYPRKKIKDVLLEHKGGSWGNDFFQGGINAKVLRSPDIRFGFIDFENAEERYFTQKEIENFNLINNDILVIKSNGSLDLVGKSQLYKENNRFPHVVASNFLMVLRPNEEIVYPEYLDLFLKSPESLVWRFDTQKTTTGLRNLNTSEFLNIEVPVPSTIKEQQRLFKTFGDYVTGKINEEETEIRRFYFLATQKETLTIELSSQDNLLSQLRQSFLREAMQGKLVKQDPKDGHAKDLLEKIKAEKATLRQAQGGKKEKELPPIKPEEIPFEIPENWVWCRLGEVCSKITDGFHNTPPKVSEGYPYIAATHVKSDKIDWESCNYVSEKYHRELYTKAFPQKGELLVVNIGAGCGTPAIIDVDFEFSFKNTAILKFNQRLVSNKLLFYYFLSRKEEIYAELTKGGLQPFLSLTILNEIEFPLPPYLEQIRIVKKLDELMNLCDELQESIEASREQNELLLQQVLKEALNG